MKKRKNRKLNSVFKKLSALYDLTNTDEIVSGKTWYRQAHDFAVEISLKYSVPLENVCGVIAAISPAVFWDLNKRQAENLISAYKTGIDPADVILSTYGDQKKKAVAILTADKTDIAGILGKQARKTIAFYRTLLNPDDIKNDVVIDRWIVRAVGFDGIQGNSLLAIYSYIAADIRLIAGKKNVLPCEFQAIIWLTIQRITNNEVPF